MSWGTGLALLEEPRRNGPALNESLGMFPPGNGVRHVVAVLGYDAGTINNQEGKFVLPRGWGYNAIEQVSFRIGK